MASKSRGGLSKKEFARAQAAKAAPKKSSSSSKATASKAKSVAPLVGAGPLLPGQKRVGGVVSGAGPLLPGQVRDTGSSSSSKSSSSSSSKSSSSKSSSSSRSLASKALGFLTGAKTANAQETGEGIDYNKVSLRPNTIRQRSGLTSLLETAADGLAPGRVLGGINKLRKGLGASGVDLPSVPDFGITEGLGLNKRLSAGTANFADDQGRGLTGSDQLAMYDYKRMQDEGNDPGDANSFMETRNNKSNGFQPQDLYSTPTQQPQTFQPNKTKNNFLEDYERTLQNEMSPQNDPTNLASAPYMGDPADAPLTDTPGGTIGNRSGRGAGLFGTGRGVGNPAGPEDEYLTMMRKSMKGYGQQEDDVMRQFKNLIKALDPTYDEYEREGKETLDRELQKNLTQLAAVMNSNNTGDSEQRAQMMAGLQRDNQGTLGDLLRKLQLQKNEDIQGYKTKSVDAVNSIRDKKMSAQERYAQAVRQYQQEQQAAMSRGSGGSTPKSYGSAIDKIMRERGVDVVTARKIYNQSNGLNTVDPLTQAMASMFGQQGGGQQIQYDENGRPYIEE